MVENGSEETNHIHHRHPHQETFRNDEHNDNDDAEEKKNDGNNMKASKSDIVDEEEQDGTTSSDYDDENEEITTTRRRRRQNKPHSLMQTIAGVAGNVLEWYDFAIFGYFDDVLGDVFFPPNQSGHNAMIESFAVFGGAFLMRPIGGMLMGYIGDTYGRKKALVISIFLMAFPTFAMGCLPPYSAVGPTAIVLLTLVRLLQGLSVGGQLVSSLVYTVESQPKSQWGHYGSYVLAAANFGTLLGGIVGFVMRESLSEEQLKSWGWRVPFLSGVLVSLSGFYLKYYSDDEEENVSHVMDTDRVEDEVLLSSSTMMMTTRRENPIRIAFRRENRRSLFSAMLVPMLWSGGFYLSFVWMAVYMEVLVDNAPIPGAFGINSASLFISVCLVFPLAGILSDKIGRVRVMTVGGASMGIFCPLMVSLIGKGNPGAAFVAQMVMGFSLSLWGAPMCAWLVESFSPEARLTSVAIGYNVAQAVIGGSSPAIATMMVDKIGKDSPGFLLTLLAVLSLVGLLCVAPRGAPERDTEESLNNGEIEADTCVEVDECDILRGELT